MRRDWSNPHEAVVGDEEKTADALVVKGTEAPYNMLIWINFPRWKCWLLVTTIIFQEFMSTWLNVRCSRPIEATVIESQVKCKRLLSELVFFLFLYGKNSIFLHRICLETCKPLTALQINTVGTTLDWQSRTRSNQRFWRWKRFQKSRVFFNKSASSLS